MQEIRQYLELAYFITGGPVLAVFAFLALKQIKVAKETASIEALRDSYCLAAEQAHLYATEIVPRLNKLDDAIKEKKITFFDTTKITVNADSVRVQRHKEEEEDLTEQISAIGSEFMDVVNRLETFALYFTSQVASEKVAYKSVGVTYVRSVHKLLPLLVISANDQNHVNVMKLFLLWNSRVEKQKLEKDKQVIDQKLKGLKSDQVIPIGTSR